ncbi:MAG: DedA family protein, partial [Clostridia bacterium]
MQEFIITIVNNFGYIGIFFLIAIENLFPPIPSEVILTFSGFITTFTNLNLIGVIISSTIGSLIGAVILYGIGRLISKDRLKKLLNCKIVRALKFKKSEIKATEGYFDKIGITAVFFCRFIPIVRSLISIPAGIEKMNFNIFLILTTFGSLIWNTVIIIIGRLVGGSWQTI